MSERAGIEADTAHRPWPLPADAWILFQSWRSLLFAHWRLEPERLLPHVVPSLELETYDGSAWLGVTPFLLTGFRARWLPAIPGLSEFRELNVRTYVRRGDRPGILFFSLDADSSLAVLGARTVFRLPYRNADMSMTEEDDGWIRYDCRRRPGESGASGEGEGAEIRFEGRYRPSGDAFRAEPGTLEHWLTERYRLYAPLAGGGLLYGDIHHPPWTLREGEAEIGRNTMAAPLGIELDRPPDRLHFAARQDTLIWPPKTDRGVG